MKLPKINNKDDLENLCVALYRLEWNAPDCQVVGRSGQSQFGVDILATLQEGQAGIQCKCYHATNFSIETIAKDVKKADENKLNIRSLLFATTASRDSGLTIAARNLSTEREANGKFRIAVAFWEDIEQLLATHKEVAARFFPGHPDSVLSMVASETAATREVVSRLETLIRGEKGDDGHKFSVSYDRDSASSTTPAKVVSNFDDVPYTAPPHQSAEAIKQSVLIDVARDDIRALRTVAARRQLDKIGPPDSLADDYLRFRWHSNLGAIEWFENNLEASVRRYELAYRLMPSDQKAIGSRIRSLLLVDRKEEARKLCLDAIASYPSHQGFWALRVAIDRLDEADLAALNPPMGIGDGQEVRFALGGAADSRGNSELACTYFHECLLDDPNLIEVRRALLTSCVTWLTATGAGEDPSLVTNIQRGYLDTALTPRDQILNEFAAIEAEPIAMELANNAYVALKLLGEMQTAAQLAEKSYARFPNAPAILAAFVRNRVAAGQWTTTKTDLIKRVGSMSEICRLAVGEVAANQGAVEWFAACEAQPMTGMPEPTITALLKMLSIAAHWEKSNREEVIRDMRVFVDYHPELATAAAILSQMLATERRLPEAMSVLRDAVARLSAESPARHRLALADAYFDLHEFAIAAELFGELVVTPGDDRATRRFIKCLIRSGNRVRARDLLKSLPERIKQSASIRRLEIELAHSSADFGALVDLLKQEYAEHANDAAVAINYASVLLATEQFNELRDLLDGDPQFSYCPPKQAFELAKLQLQFGDPQFGLQRLYKLWRENPNDVEVAQYYFSQRLIYGDALNFGRDRDAGIAVLVEHQGTSNWFVVDSSTQTAGQPWPESLPANSAFAVVLKNARVGDSVERPGLFSHKVKVVELASIEHFALLKARELIEKNSSNNKIIQVLNVGETGMGAFIRDMTKHARNVEKTIHSLFQAYERSSPQRPLPLALLASRLNTNEIALVNDWPVGEVKLHVSDGNRSGREAAHRILADDPHLIVDLVTLVELQRIGALEALVLPTRRVMVPSLVKQRLRYLKHSGSEMKRLGKPVGKFYTANGKPGFAPPDDETSLLEKTNALLEFVDKRCEVVPVLGPVDYSPVDRLLEATLDPITSSVFLLSRERNCAITTIDLNLIWLLQIAFGQKSVDLQSLIADATQRGVFSSKQHATFIASLISAKRQFIGFSVRDLMVLSRESVSVPEPSVLDLLRSCENPWIEIAGAVQIGCAFLRIAASEGVGHRVIGHYAYVLRNSLVRHKRDWSHKSIDMVLIDTLESIFGVGAANLPPSERASMRALLERKVGKRFLHSALRAN